MKLVRKNRKFNRKLLQEVFGSVKNPKFKFKRDRKDRI